MSFRGRSSGFALSLSVIDKDVTLFDFVGPVRNGGQAEALPLRTVGLSAP
jgi:hypothetical protein